MRCRGKSWKNVGGDGKNQKNVGSILEGSGKLGRIRKKECRHRRGSVVGTGMGNWGFMDIELETSEG
jgi:hypothetical protein